MSINRIEFNGDEPGEYFAWERNSPDPFKWTLWTRGEANADWTAYPGPIWRESRTEQTGQDVLWNVAIAVLDGVKT